VLHDNVDGREHHARDLVEEGERVLAGVVVHALADHVEQVEVGVVHDTGAQIAGDVERAEGLRVQLVALAEHVHDMLAHVDGEREHVVVMRRQDEQAQLGQVGGLAQVLQQQLVVLVGAPEVTHREENNARMHELVDRPLEGRGPIRGHERDLQGLECVVQTGPGLAWRGLGRDDERPPGRAARLRRREHGGSPLVLRGLLGRRALVLSPHG
jgi:hypothetical protein